MGAATERFSDRRHAVLSAAAQEFNDHGFRGATLAGVAARVGLQKASLNYYYRHKEELAAACLLDAIAEHQALAAAACKPGDPAERIRSLFAGKAALHAEVAEGKRAALVSFNEIRALQATAGQEVSQAYGGLFRAVRHCLPGHHDLSHAARNARAHLLLTTMNALPDWLAAYAPPDYRAVAAQVADGLLCGLALPGQCARKPVRIEQADLQAQDSASQTREAFLRAATVLVNDQGFRGASVERIAATIHLTKGAFYHHHASKDELVTLCFERSFDIVRRTQMAAIAHLESGTDRLDASIRALVEFQLSAQGPLLRSTARSVLSDTAQREIALQNTQLTQRFSLFILDGMLEGRLRIVDPSLAARQVSNAINAAASLRRWVPDLRADQAARLFVDPLFDGILRNPH